MSDGKRKHIPADSSRVNVYEQFEVEYWTKKWGCTGAELRGAVEVTSSIMADKIEGYLKTKGKLGRLQLGLREREMAKFKIGDMVFYRPLSAHSRNAARGAYEVIRVLPSQTAGHCSYQIKSTQEDHERDAEETELVAV